MEVQEKKIIIYSANNFTLFILMLFYSPQKQGIFYKNLVSCKICVL